MRVIITGASRGIGFAIASSFAEKAHEVFICARGEVQLYNAANELTTRFPGSTIHAKPSDLSIKEEAVAFGEWCLSFGTPDILVNNAGLFEPGEVTLEPVGTLERQIAVNLYSAYHLTRTLVPPMKERRSGHIFNVCSIASLGAYPNGGSYSISKFALNGFHQNLRSELKRFDIKVTAIYPGAVHTDSWEGFDNSGARIMEARDIADLVLTASQLSPGACVEEIMVRPLRGDL